MEKMSYSSTMKVVSSCIGDVRGDIYTAPTLACHLTECHLSLGYGWGNRDADRVSHLPTSHSKEEMRNHTDMPPEREQRCLCFCHLPLPIQSLQVLYHSLSQPSGLALIPFWNFCLPFSSQRQKRVFSTSDHPFPHCKGHLFSQDEVLSLIRFSLPMLQYMMIIPQIRQPSPFPNEKISKNPCPPPPKFWLTGLKELYDQYVKITHIMIWK